VYEPDGNIPPDFVVNGRIAIEVRRLNYNRMTKSGETRGLEKLQFDLLNCMKGVFSSLGPPKAGKSWFVDYTFSRPIPSLTKLKRDVRKVLSAFRDGQVEDREFFLTDRFKMGLIPSSEVFADCFVLGGYVDRDAGGWLIQELENNVRLCVQEKSKKILDIRAKYPEWWIILIDHIGYGARESIHVEHDWDKVILVNPLNPEQGYEI
jgi:hypothetical protein